MTSTRYNALPAILLVFSSAATRDGAGETISDYQVTWAGIPAMMDAFRGHGVEVVHSWGMTELSPLGTACRLQERHRTLPAAAQDAVLAKARSTEPRRFGNPASAMILLREVGIAVAQLDATDWNPDEKDMSRSRSSQARASSTGNSASEISTIKSSAIFSNRWRISAA